MKYQSDARVVSGVFTSRDEAHKALDALAPTGVEGEDISVITSLKDFEEEEFSEIAGIRLHDETVHAVKIGRFIGAFMAGLTALIGMVFGEVALIPAVLIILVSAVFGGLLGTLIAGGFTESEWAGLDTAIQNGKVLVAVHTHDLGTSRKVGKVLKECHAEAVHSH